MSVDKVLYRATAQATGGRDGRTTTPNGPLDLQLSVPKELGGPGGNGTNPEQLFAAGYSACFLSAMKFIAGRDKLTVPATTTVTAKVGIGPIPNGFGIEVDLEIHMPGLSLEDAQIVVDRAHMACPYSNATRNNIDVRLSIV